MKNTAILMPFESGKTLPNRVNQDSCTELRLTPTATLKQKSVGSICHICMLLKANDKHKTLAADAITTPVPVLMTTCQNCQDNIFTPYEQAVCIGCTLPLKTDILSADQLKN